MDFNDFKKDIKEQALLNNIDINEDNIEKFYIYMKEILEWNEKINVTAIVNEKEFIVKHFIDSLTVSKEIEDSKSVIDIGTGAGFPGIPLKLNYPDKKITLIDAVNKKLNVIRSITEKFGLENLEIIHTRAEDLATNKNYRENYDIAITRAVSNLSTIMEYMLPFVKVGGKAICMKGPSFQEELDESQKAIKILGGKIEKIETILVNGEIERNLIIINKIKETPKQFPRGKGKPQKEPIK